MKRASSELRGRNGNRTIYVRASDQPIWELAKRIAAIDGYEGVSVYLLDLVRADLKNNKRAEHIKAKFDRDMNAIMEEINAHL